MDTLKTWITQSWCRDCDKPRPFRAAVDADDLAATGAASCEATCQACGTQKHFIYYSNGQPKKVGK